MLPHLGAVAARQHGVFTRAQALAAGYGDSEIKALLRDGAWIRVRHGVYTEAAANEPRLRHLQRCRSALLVSGPGALLAGPSAALAHGLSVVAVPPQVHLVSPNSRTASGILVIRRPEADEGVEVDGMSVTGLAQTVVDSATRLDLAESVVVADSALRRGLSRTALMGAAERSRHSSRVLRAARFADGNSESVGESLARVALDVAGLPRPVLQHEMRLPGGRRYRVDFFWPEHRTVGEFDGKVKYGDDPAALWKEKRREDEIRGLGYAFVRFGMAEVYRPAALGGLVRTGFARGRQLAG